MCERGFSDSTGDSGWYEFRLSGPLPGLEAFADFMAEAGAAGAIFSEDPSSPGGQMVTAFLSIRSTSPELLDLIRARASFLAETNPQAPVCLEITCIQDRDWSEEWKQSLRPLWLEPGIWIIPTHCSLPAEAEHEPHLLLDPGLAFGTGHHATTRLCATAVAQAVKAGARRVLDIGTGTGILAMIAARLGAERVLAVDIDPIALRVARENCELNSLAQKVELRSGVSSPEEEWGEKFDLIAANLFPEALAGILEFIARHLAEDGIAALSGIIPEREEEVRAWVENSALVVHDRREEEEWVMLLLKSAA